MTERIITDANGRKHITTEPLLHPTGKQSLQVALLKQALEALEHIQRCICFDKATIHHGSATWAQTDDAIAAIKQHLGEV